MTSLVAMADFLPEDRVSIESLAEPFGLTTMQVRVFRKYHKIGEALRDPGGSLVDLLRHAVDALDLTPALADRVRYVLYARTFPVVTPYPLNPLASLCASVGLRHAQAFAVSHHACASGLLAIDLAGRLLAAEPPDALALVLAGEKTFTGETQFIPETSMFGEGASACLISADGTRDRQLSYGARLRGEFDGEQDDVAGEYQRIYHDALAEAITAAVDAAGLTLGDVALILPHNVNTVAWRQVCKRLGFPLDRVVLDHVATSGHLFCADAFVNHRTAVRRGLLHPGDRYVIAAAGAGRGATFSAMVFEH
jgi:3-oxoacyl-[acyl-carrier-protein] synthase-3